MSRTAQDVLEFDKLRELLRLRTTCAPGRRAVDTLEPGVDRVALEAVFAQIREAQQWLRCPSKLAIVPGATHLFEEPGALQTVTRLARKWFTTHFTARSPSST